MSSQSLSKGFWVTQAISSTLTEADKLSIMSVRKAEIGVGTREGFGGAVESTNDDTFTVETIDDFIDEEGFATFERGGGRVPFITFEAGPFCFPLLIKKRALFKSASEGLEGGASVEGS